MKKFLFGSVMSGLLSAFSVSVSVAAPQKVAFTCPDGKKLTGLYVAPKPNMPVYILHHGLAAQASEWTPLLTELEKKGWGGLAYDSRPSGTAWTLLVNDVGAALRYLEKEQHVERRQIFLGGASLGANVMLKYHVLTSNGAGVILLSPGIDYQGLTTGDLISQITAPVLLVASAQDVYAYQSCDELQARNRAVAFWSDVKAGHGVQMFDDKLLKRLIAWTADHAPNAKTAR